MSIQSISFTGLTKDFSKCSFERQIKLDVSPSETGQNDNTGHLATRQLLA